MALIIDNIYLWQP